jgi:hypothetical protein
LTEEKLVHGHSCRIIINPAKTQKPGSCFGRDPKPLPGGLSAEENQAADLYMLATRRILEGRDRRQTLSYLRLGQRFPS